MPQRWITLMGTALAGAWLVGCASPTFEARQGYGVEHRFTSPSHNSRVRHLVLHYTDVNETESLAVLTGPHVSAHYVLPLPPREQRGQPLVYQLVDESRRAWHAGASTWKGRPNINDTSIGIEIVNTGPDRPYAEVEQLLETHTEAAVEVNWAPYPDEQIDALIALSRDIIERHSIHPTDVVAHSDIAPMRKIDPGPRFPWRKLHEAGIGVWPDEERVVTLEAHFRRSPLSVAKLQEGLESWGYPIDITGELDQQTRSVLRAFQMRFRPADYRGHPDAETMAILWGLLETYRPEQRPWLPADSPR
ncbi:N-acetylmuramoyl-L-alanine amidase [Billgrantia saliphila]|uniref:N-acetylmuramoyl-L-alanine amidase n=1 Tax=Billgrantia saliphila TaxID=1848458 RepID=UPI000CE3CAF2|nr:N-acetylmuramoyl-L-alanine amidase [Halomonas saliphila]